MQNQTDKPPIHQIAPTMDGLRSLAHQVMITRGLEPEFPPAALAETNALDHAPTERGPKIRDLRDRLWASIDNDSSRDLDQLSVAEPLAGGAVKIFIAIADVDAAVKRGSAIDEHAQTNTTSVYTAAQIFPMLPEKLSTDLTSLNEGEDRLAIVVELEVNKDGTVLKSDVYRALVHNRAKLAYNSVAAWLAGEAAAPPHLAAVPGLDEQLRIQDRVAQAMRALRYQHGALSLKTLEAQPVFVGEVLSDLRAEEPNAAKELIEDFMIGANGATARFLEQHGYSSLRRVLRIPNRWDRIVALADELGGHLPAEPSGEALAKFLNRCRHEQPERFADISVSVIKLLGRGEYVLEIPGQRPSGHFGLAVSDYTHSTAPNRRFPDLVTQRILKAALNAQPAPYTNEELSALARHCTEQETNAAKVERQVRKSAAALLLSSRVGERFAGIITGANDKGTWVRIIHPAAEGRVVRGFSGLDVGDRVHVQLLAVDVERGYVDFANVKHT